MARISILIGAHLTTAPRPQKEAETLAAAGHDVTVCGIWHDPSLVERDRALMAGKRWRFKPIIDFRRESLKGYSRSFYIRLSGRLSRERYTRFGTVSPSLYGYGAKAMLSLALREKADLTIVHSEAGLWVGAQLLERGLRVGVDLEDWFSEDLLPESRRSRPIEQLKTLERLLLTKCDYRITTSNVLAEALAQAYDVPKPAVVYNVFPFSERECIDEEIVDRSNLTLPSLHWFSQTIGPGRGLEIFFEALKFISGEAEIHLRGACSVATREWVEALIPQRWKKSIFIHPTVSNDALLSRIAEHDVGLALELPYCANKQFTVSNKLFQYLLGGLALIATDTAGQKEEMSRCIDAGQLIPANNLQALADSIRFVLHNREGVLKAKDAALRAAKELFSWEHQAENLLHEAERALSMPTLSL